MIAGFGRWLRLFSVLTLAMLGARAVEAQLTSGALLGTVADAGGGIVAGATVTAVQRDTGFTRTTRTDASGAFSFPNMPLGRYDIRVEREGFKTQVIGPVALVVDQKRRLDVVLEVGQVKETVEVSGAATLLQTDQPDVNQIVQEKEIKALPLNGRDFFSLLLLSNGVQDTSNDQGGATTNVTFSVNGMRPEANSVTLDGVQMSSVRESDVDLRPNVDAISEFKVLTSVFSAEYGHTAGGVISIQTKSGTNAVHGSAFEFHRNDALNAKNYFTNPVDPQKAPLKQNQFGFTLGGPLRKDKTFFFVDYQGETVRKVTEAFARVPEEPFRRGDFSSLLPGTVIYDPATGGNVPFPGNIIPRDRWNQFGWTLLNMVDLPNLPSDYPLGNYFVRQHHRIDGHEGGFRIDHTISPADRVFLRFRMNNSHLFTSDAMSRPDGPLPGLALGVNDDSRGIIQGGTHDDRNYNAVLSHIHLFGSRLVNEARIGFHRYELDVESNAQGRNLAEANGLHGVNRDALSSGLPMLYLDGYYTNFGGDDWKPLYFRNTFWQFNDTLTWSAGAHSLKFGAEYRRRREDDYFAVFPAGAFYVGTFATSQQFSWSQGNELASLLLGYPSFGYLGRRFGSPVLDDRQYAGFFQDDWKVDSKLTLNLGLRYDYATPFFSPTNELSMFDLDQGRMVVAGQDGVSRYLVNPDHNDFAPRVGLAYQIDKKTTLRTGFGVFYSPETAKRDDVRHNPPFYRQATFYDQWKFSDPAPPALPDSGPYPKGYDVKTVDKDLKTGYSLQYSLAVQRELPGGVLFEAAYVGSQGHRLPFVVNVNQAQPDGSPAPYPGIGKVLDIRAIGDSTYNSAQFKVEKRFGEGLFLLGTYTWSKSLDTVSSAMFDSQFTGGVQNIFDVKQNRGPSDWDVPHRFSLSYVYDLPYGKRARADGGPSGVLGALLGNWRVSGLFVARSGMPGTVTVGSAIPGGDARPNVLRDPNLPGSERSVEHWFDTSAFVANVGPDGRTLLAGNAGRNIIRGPAYVNLDMGLIKFIPIKNDMRLQLRAEAFNLTNTPHFALPVLRMSDPAFGKITHTRNSTNFGSTATSFANRMTQLAVKLEF
jgi:Carboxypeptidase regulatory-like domain/TonB dependent receptor-like, beta-barrel/TonB-dependent Receptor Plug Domain